MNAWECDAVSLPISPKVTLFSFIHERTFHRAKDGLHLYVLHHIIFCNFDLEGPTQVPDLYH